MPRKVGSVLAILPAFSFSFTCISFFDALFLCVDKFTDSAIATNSKVNGEHKDKVLMRWDGGETNPDDYDLESDMVSVEYMDGKL